MLANLGNLAWDVGDLGRAARFNDGALQLFERLGDRRGAALCLNNLAVLAQQRGDADRAVELVEAALDAFRAAGDRHGEAAMHHNLAAMWNDAGAVAEATASYEEAAARFDELGDPARADQARQRIAVLRPPASGLSRREQEVAALVAAGLGNREIAERLFISQRTVESHVSHIFTKLDLRSRTQLARWCTDQRAGDPVRV